VKLWSRVVDRLFGYRNGRKFSESEKNRLTLLHDSGFFSNCSALLLSLAQQRTHPVVIDASQSFTHFTEGESRFDWNRYFKDAQSSALGNPKKWGKSRVANRLPHHSIYKLINFRITNEIVRNYFGLSEEVLRRAREIEKKSLPVPLAELLVVCVRGTDKGTEVRQSSIHSYVTTAKRLQKRNKKLRVWIQTDQAQIRDLLLEELGPKSFSLDVLPVTKESTVIHKSANIPSKNQFTADLVAVTWLMSQVHSVITYSGNVGYWIALFRGSARRLYQLR
jgi:hypothetical protein